jgi:hypothetical protein
VTNYYERSAPYSRVPGNLPRGRGQAPLAKGETERERPILSWFDELVDQGKIRRGQRLRSESRTIGRKSAIIDGPFGGSKLAIGGYRFVLAQNLDEAAQIVKGDPCLDHGKLVEIRPLDSGAGTHGCWRNELATPDNASQ